MKPASRSVQHEARIAQRVAFGLAIVAVVVLVMWVSSCFPALQLVISTSVSSPAQSPLRCGPARPRSDCASEQRHLLQVACDPFRANVEKL